MGLEVQIEISMGYIAIWENLTKKWVFSQTKRISYLRPHLVLERAHCAKNVFESKCGRKARVLQEEKKKRKKKEKRISGMDHYRFVWIGMDLYGLLWFCMDL